MFSRVLVANRGEIARRVIRTLDRLGIASVSVFTEADRDAPHVREAGHRVPITSYLDIASILEACAQIGAEALHPGYGFLSENPAFARACAQAGVTFIGPPPEASELMGDKIRAKAAAAAAGVPVVPSYSESDAASAAASDYPLLVKAAAGGGGRGMRVVHAPDELEAALASARREAQAGFGDDRVFIERFLPRARHIEVQIMADAHGGIVHLGERECSLQRRHQKVIEEAPSPVVDAALREQLGSEAVALARAGGYQGAGTVEFIAAADDPVEHYFLEMNARLQVEHPVTECVCGLDLVELQLRVAAGEPLGLAQSDIAMRGHAIEARITAEDAAHGFLPATGRVLAYERPAGARVDDAIEIGSVIDTSFDSLLAKVIVHGADRPAALGKLARALQQFNVLGVTTTTGFLRGLLEDEDVVAGRLDTGLIERREAPTPPMDDAGVATAAAMMMLAERHDPRSGGPFARTDGWRLSGRRSASHWRLAVGGRDPVDVEVPAEYVAATHRLGPGRFAIDARGEWLMARDGETVWAGHGGYAWPVRPVPAGTEAGAAAGGDLRAPMPGAVLLVPVTVGQRVQAGDPVVVLESMKMELAITAPVAGVVAELSVAVGDRVVVDQPLAHVEAHEPATEAAA